MAELGHTGRCLVEQIERAGEIAEVGDRATEVVEHLVDDEVLTAAAEEFDRLLERRHRTERIALVEQDATAIGLHPRQIELAPRFS